MAAKRIDLHDKTILYQYQNGITIKKIAALNYVSQDTIYRRLKKMNAVVNNPFKRLVSKEKLIELYNKKKWSISAIASKYKVSYKTVRKTMKDYNLPIRGIQSEENNERTEK
jgi:transposase